MIPPVPFTVPRCTLSDFVLASPGLHPALIRFPQKSETCLLPSPQLSITSPFFLSHLSWRPKLPPLLNLRSSPSPPEELRVPSVLLSASECSQAPACLTLPPQPCLPAAGYCSFALLFQTSVSCGCSPALPSHYEFSFLFTLGGPSPRMLSKILSPCSGCTVGYFSTPLDSVSSLCPQITRTVWAAMTI